MVHSGFYTFCDLSTELSFLLLDKCAWDPPALSPPLSCFQAMFDYCLIAISSASSSVVNIGSSSVASVSVYFKWMFRARYANAIFSTIIEFFDLSKCCCLCNKVTSVFTTDVLECRLCHVLIAILTQKNDDQSFVKTHGELIQCKQHIKKVRRFCHHSLKLESFV